MREYPTDPHKMSLFPERDRAAARASELIAERMDELVAELSPMDAALLELRSEGFPWKQVAERLGASESSCKSRWRRLRSSMQARVLQDDVLGALFLTQTEE